MEQKMNRIIRACIESEEGAGNPIRSIHDQGAGGNGKWGIFATDIVRPQWSGRSKCVGRVCMCLQFLII